MSIRRKNDVLWKGMLEEVFDDFLHFVFPKAEELFDFTKGFEFLDKELNELFPEPHTKPATRYVDKLVKVTRQNGKNEWLLIHVEVQDQSNSSFPERMFQYYYRIYDKYQSPLTAIAILTGRNTKAISPCYEHHCLGTHLRYVYNTLRITDYSDEALETSNNPFALVVLAVKKALLTDKTPDMERLRHKLLVAKILLSKKSISHKKVKVLLSFLNNYILFKEKQTNTIFTNEIDQITAKERAMGYWELLGELKAEEVIERNNRRVVRNLLRQSNFSMVKIASIAGVSLDFVKKIKKSIRVK